MLNISSSQSLNPKSNMQKTKNNKCKLNKKIFFFLFYAFYRRRKDGCFFDYEF